MGTAKDTPEPWTPCQACLKPLVALHFPACFNPMSMRSSLNAKIKSSHRARHPRQALPGRTSIEESAVKVLSSLKSAKQRHRDCKVVRRRGKVFVICKSNPRFKARQR